MNVHIYRAADQPLTHYTIDFGDGRKATYDTNPRAAYHCHNCHRRRWAKNLRIQVYYDTSCIFCAGGCPKRKRGRK